MSRSTKRTPIIGMKIPASTRGYKTVRARAERSHQRALTAQATKGDENAQLRLEVEAKPWDEWSCERDGKQWIGGLADAQSRARLMRK